MTVIEEQYEQPGMRLGLKPTPEEHKRKLIRFSEITTGTVPSAPLVDDNEARVIAGKGFDLYANNRFGDCGPVSVANLYKMVSAALQGAQFDFTLDEVLDLYKRSGNPDFDPATGAGDSGVEMTTMLSELVRNGIGKGARNVRALAYAAVDPTSYDDMRLAIDLFGGVLWGSDLQQAQERQFAGHQVWDYVAGSPDWGGHATVTGRYFDSADDTADRMWTVTWASAQPVTNAFLTHSVQECYVVIWPLNLGTQQFQAGVDYSALAAAYQQATGQALPSSPATPPSPSPAPSTPTPAPSTGGGASTADQAFYQSVKRFVADANTWVAAAHINTKGA